MSRPGRVCPVRYRYGAAAIARAPTRHARVLYVIGGLYGNVAALDRIVSMAQEEGERPTLSFNGDFNWFDVDDDAFDEVNRRVLCHDAIQGNVEAELGAPADDAGCGCAYPESVGDDVVERSNSIHRMLKATAQRHPLLLDRIIGLPMFARYSVGACRVGVVHGDADSLAGWGFDADVLADPESLPRLNAALATAEVDVFASTHTCLPAIRRFDSGWVANNGAAGMPNFAGDLAGLITRIGVTPSPHPALGEFVVAGAHVALLRVPFDADQWRIEFLRQWPPGSPAWLSYFDRITRGPAYSPEQALPPDTDQTLTTPCPSFPRSPTTPAFGTSLR